MTLNTYARISSLHREAKTAERQADARALADWNLNVLLERVEKTTEASRDLDELIAEHLLGVHKWKSKHGYWHVDFPDGYPFEEYGQRLHTVTLDGRSPDALYDPTTGGSLAPEEPPSGWVWDIGIKLPEYTASIDAAVNLTERLFFKSLAVHAQIELTALTAPSGGKRTTVTILVGSKPQSYSASADTTPLAILAALLKALIARNAAQAEPTELAAAPQSTEGK